MFSGGAAISLSDSIHVTSNKFNKVLVLNRPKNLNSLNVEMCNQIKSNLDEWHDRRNVSSFIMKGAGEKAFCAGNYSIRISLLVVMFNFASRGRCQINI